MRIILTILLLIGLSSCFKEDEPVPAYKSPDGIFTNTAEVGEFYENQVYFNLETNEFVKTEPRANWDLAFEADADGKFIFLNGASLMRVIKTGSTNFDSIFSTQGKEWFYDNSNGNIDELAIGEWFTEEGNSIISKQEVYLIDRGFTPLGNDRGMIKFQVFGLQNNSYQIKFSALNQTSANEIIIPKNELYNYVHLSFDNNGELVFAEPPKNEWDLVFTQYTAKVTQITTGIVEDYSVNGVLINKNGVEVALELLASFEEIKFTDLENYNFTIYRDAIGYEWKDFEFDNNSYSIADFHTYLIKSVEGNYFKLRFTSFVNAEGKRGYPSLEFGRF